MSGTKRLALRRPKSQKANLRGWLPLAVVVSCTLAAPVQAQQLPLPPEEQDAVKEAIARGVEYLKRTQQKSGTWAKVGEGHRIGYAILPGLTLLECGLPAGDPMIRKAADYLRARAATLDTTYELALGILFLDRLGDPKDKSIIQTFALRLAAGQSPTGGWGYKCPLFPPRSQRELLIALRHLNSLMQGSGGSPPTGGANQPGEPSLSGERAGSRLGDKPYVIPERLRALAVLQNPAVHDLRDPPWMLDGHRLRHAKDLLHMTEDLPGMRDSPYLTSTDNSNTQFAILALWTAQRYDVPMHRTLNLIVRRYGTSQNGDGSWNYLYCFGGAREHEFFSSAGAMTCVGLIGLAVGHGMAQPVPAGRLVQDPRILKGLNALYRMVGRPTDRLTKVPLQNLYFLWSLQRVAVLYRMPAIGDKDWYRWGAQIIVTNQDRKGSWHGGGYPGSSPTPDTCLALLFLKRADLVKDLTAKLSFKAADLNHGIMQNPKPPPLAMTATPKPPELPKSIEKTILAVTPPKQEAAGDLITKPLSSLEDTASAGAANAADANPGAGGGKAKWIVLSLLVFLLFAGGSVSILFAARQRDADDEEKNGKSKNRHKLNHENTKVRKHERRKTK